MIYNPIFPPYSDADKIMIVDDGEIIYNCYKRPNVEITDENIYERPIWKIEKIVKENREYFVSYERLYPNGDTGYNYSVADYLTYNYKFKN